MSTESSKKEDKSKDEAATKPGRAGRVTEMMSKYGPVFMVLQNQILLEFSQSTTFLLIWCFSTSGALDWLMGFDGCRYLWGYEDGHVS